MLFRPLYLCKHSSAGWSLRPQAELSQKESTAVGRADIGIEAFNFDRIPYYLTIIENLHYHSFIKK